MKKYLFDKIKVDTKGVKFIPFRKATIPESLLAYTHTTFNQDRWEFIPISFDEFLKMLSKTKLDENNNYNISTPFNPLTEEIASLSFEELLQYYTAFIYQNTTPNNKAIENFYSKAHAIKKEAESEAETLTQTPQELA